MFFRCKKNSLFDCHWTGKNVIHWMNCRSRSCAQCPSGSGLLSRLSRWRDLTPVLKSAIIRIRGACSKRTPPGAALHDSVRATVSWVASCVCLLVFPCIWRDCGLCHPRGWSMMIKITDRWLKIFPHALVYLLFPVMPFPSAPTPTEPSC